MTAVQALERREDPVQFALEGEPNGPCGDDLDEGHPGTPADSHPGDHAVGHGGHRVRGGPSERRRGPPVRSPGDRRGGHRGRVGRGHRGRRALRPDRAGVRTALALPDAGPHRPDERGALRGLRELRPGPRPAGGGGDPSRRGHRRRRRGGGGPGHVPRRAHGLRLRHQCARDPVGRPNRRQRTHHRRGVGRGLDLRLSASRGPVDGGVRDPSRDPEVRPGRGPLLGPQPDAHRPPPAGGRAVVGAGRGRVPGLQLRHAHRAEAGRAGGEVLAADSLRPGRGRRRETAPTSRSVETLAGDPRPRWPSTPR